MVSVIDNRADVVCIPVNPVEPDEEEGWWHCRVRIEQVDDVADWPNLLTDAPGRVLTALLPEPMASTLAPEDLWRLRVALVRPNLIRADPR